MEIEYGPFSRQIRLSEDVAPDGATARYEHGILTISLPIASRPLVTERYTIVVERR
jgi:HSP20 family molecular chaperone IbpA